MDGIAGIEQLDFSTKRGPRPDPQQPKAGIGATCRRTLPDW
jgi:hypothetical protein